MAGLTRGSFGGSSVLAPDILDIGRAKGVPAATATPGFHTAYQANGAPYLARDTDIPQADPNAAMRLSMLNGLQAAFSGGGAQIQAPQVTAPTVNVTPAAAQTGSYSPSPYDTAADSAAYGQAKTRTAQAVQASLHSLTNAMASRGISGSGIEGRAIADTYAKGNQDLADVNTSLAETQAGRAFTHNEAGLQRGEQAREFDTTTGTDVAKFNAGNNLGAQEFNANSNLSAAQLAQSRLSGLVSAFRGLY